MKLATILCAASVLALAGCATTPPSAPVPMGDQTQAGANASEMGNRQATSTANKPGSGMGNSGGGLSQNMTPQEAVQAFRMMDSNHDGYVDKSEFTNYGDSGQRFAGCDTNGDGKLSLDEYVACSQRPATNGE